MNWQPLLASFEQLDEAEKRAFFRAIRDRLFPEQSPDLGRLLPNVRETRFKAGLACIYCGALSVKRNGTYRGRQRYLCLECHKSFNDLTASPMSGTHHPEKWLDYFEMMLEGRPLHRIADELRIHISTAFYWRHKILYALRALGELPLGGVVESDETFILESEKGNRHLTHRPARYRGGTSEKRGISRDQVCIVVAVDRNGQVVSGVAGRGRVPAQALEKVLGTYLPEDCILCTDSAANYALLARQRGLQHVALNVRRGIKTLHGIYNLGRVDGYHGEFKKWFARFNGVATKYLDNYLFWYRFLHLHKTMAQPVRKEKMVLDACTRPERTTANSFRKAS